MLARRRGRTRKGRPAGRYMMCVHVSDDGHTHLAVLEGRSLVEHYMSSLTDADTSIDGNIYLGKVQNVLPGMEAGVHRHRDARDGVLYRGDVAFDRDEVEESQPRIERLLKNGQPIMVQVTKNPIGAKGARLTQEVASPAVSSSWSRPARRLRHIEATPRRRAQRLRRVLEDLQPRRRADRAHRGRGRHRGRAASVTCAAAPAVETIEPRRRPQQARPAALPGAAPRPAPAPARSSPRSTPASYIDDPPSTRTSARTSRPSRPSSSTTSSSTTIEEEGLPLFERFHTSGPAPSRRSSARSGCRRAVR